MSRSMLLAAILVLAFFGIADAWYLSQAALTDTALWCGVNTPDGCNIVAQSEYSRLFGIPLALYGLVFYIATFVLAAAALFERIRYLPRALVGLGLLGLLSSLYFLYLQIFRIEALCIYCVASFVISTLIFGVTVLLDRMERKEPAMLP